MEEQDLRRVGRISTASSESIGAKSTMVRVDLSECVDLNLRSNAVEV